MTRPGMLIVDVQRCIACQRCEVYCAVAHSESKELETAIREDPAPQARVQVKELGPFSAPYQCRHCDDPPCVEACPTDSLAKGQDARVALDLGSCTGQAKCVKRCSFLGIWMDTAGTQAVKCDLCVGRLEQGGVPACAEACPTGAITYKRYEELTEEELALRSGSPGAALVRRTGVRYVIDPELCIGCTICAKTCPAEAAVGEKKQPHRILQDKCVTCGGCFLKCPKDAIVAVAPEDLEAVEAEMAAKLPEADESADGAPAEGPAADAPVEPAAEAPVADAAPTEEAPADEPAEPEPAAAGEPSGPGRKELRRRDRKARRRAKRGKRK